MSDEPVSNTKSKRGKQTETSIDWLASLVESNKINVCIFSSRNFQEGGIDAMQNWLLDNGLSKAVLNKISFPTEKVPAVLHIDDRAVQFTGNFFNVNDILNFKPYKQK